MTMTTEDQVTAALKPHVRPHLLYSATRRLTARLAGLDDDAIAPAINAWLAAPENKHFLRDPRVEALMAALR